MPWGSMHASIKQNVRVKALPLERDPISTRAAPAARVALIVHVHPRRCRPEPCAAALSWGSSRNSVTHLTTVSNGCHVICLGTLPERLSVEMPFRFARISGVGAACCRVLRREARTSWTA